MNIADLTDNQLDGIFQSNTTNKSPFNLEVEQMLLGAILCNNNALNHIGEKLKPEHFYEHLHQKIFNTILQMHSKGRTATHVTLANYCSENGFNLEREYLAKLAISAVTVINIKEFSAILIDLHAKRELISIAENLINQINSASIDMDSNYLLEQTEQKLFRLAQTGSTTKTLTPFKIIGKQTLEIAENAHKNKSPVIGVSTGLDKLDNLLGGLQKSDLIILAGRPSMGKTALATTISYKAAKNFMREAGEGKPQSVAFFSLEMSNEQLATRIYAAEADVNSSSIMRGRLSDSQFNHLIYTSNLIEDMPFLGDDTAGISISSLCSKARRFKRTHNIGLIVVDYLQLVTNGNNKNFNRVQEVSEITQSLKGLAKELNVPVIALSQLSRDVEKRDDKRPLLSDLRESGSIEQDADVVMFVYREQYYLERSKPEQGTTKFASWQEEYDKVVGRADIIIAKQRHGAIGTVTLQFDSDKARFRD